MARLASPVDPRLAWPSLTAETEGQVHSCRLASRHLPTDVVREPLEDRVSRHTFSPPSATMTPGHWLIL